MACLEEEYGLIIRHTDCVDFWIEVMHTKLIHTQWHSHDFIKISFAFVCWLGPRNEEMADIIIVTCHTLQGSKIIILLRWYVSDKQCLIMICHGISWIIITCHQPFQRAVVIQMRSEWSSPDYNNTIAKWIISLSTTITFFYT